MTHQLSPTSTRLAAARAFGDRLQTLMAKRQVGQLRLAQAAGVARSSVVQWRLGRNLPTLETAIRVADSLGDSRLAEIVREGRTQPCQRCGKPFLNEGGAPKKFCSQRCLTVDQKLRDYPTKRTPGVLRRRIRELETEGQATAEELAQHVAAVAAMCTSCEPEGFCRTANCPLRPVSPLQLTTSRRSSAIATKAPGAWGTPANREKLLAAIRAANARRWGRPGERERLAESSRQRHAAKTPEERSEAAKLMRSGGAGRKAN